MADLKRLQRMLGYQFQDEGLLVQALTHRSVGSKNNERMEFLGDAILGFEIAENLFQRHPHASEGELSRARAQLVKRETLASVARDLQLGEYLILGVGELRSGGQTRDSILSDAVEALIAAVYLDADIDSARALVRRVLKDRIASCSPREQLKDAKTRLQELLQAQGKALPVYEVVSVEGHAHEQRFMVKCVVDSLGITQSGEGSSRRKAEQQAARNVLIETGEHLS
ncbi:ribonuclease III [Thiolapillus brandeum]|uniref:Ribonuclease 3 n=1 Tax=Thiolapillus brandeum TaxID=1076588 RepID=A0A7U6GI63_9GAMM|nr:ribonuclease III [Thiolapillus brandeum]BAO44057.1 ribonuclease III [Thiolapillus brandeum]